LTSPVSVITTDVSVLSVRVVCCPTYLSWSCTRTL